MILLLAMTLSTAPIPKADYEGTIVLVKAAPSPVELILMKPDGTIIRRIEPK